ncbi:MAG TPA: acyl--CoA ligase [Dehalococcoidia bacterium]|nr:acyl--CoA ligase [Dehalococcoidia bacterium]
MAGPVSSETVAALLRGGEASQPALISTGRLSLSHAGLRAAVERMRSQLRAAGVRRGDRVAIVLPNGPEMALAFLAVATCATAAPLNPSYREEEFRFYLHDLGAKALITLPGDAREAHAAAGEGILRIAIDREGDSIGLSNSSATAFGDPEEPAPDDVALVLHTSGTTSRPKLVPLTQRNLAASAANILRSLELTPEDRCLNVMPLFHIHGLMAGLLAPLAAGGSVVCSPGFDAFRFLGWLEAHQPTWYTAVPTMHQLVLARAERDPRAARKARLRFLRSSSAPMPPVVMQRLEVAFDAPLIEAYGMTEAAHQMATNPLPPGVRKPGSVGRGAGVEVAIMDDAGSTLGEGQRGEVVVRGANVMPGYEGDPQANAAAFVDGWLRTGDEGFLDGDGYLHLTGRLKELINRGGEKVSPREVDEVLLLHPAVAQAVAFALPHERLGEEVAAAVVLADGASVGERELREHAASHLADFKVPRKIVIVPEIPKGPTGKLQRIGLAEKLGLGPPGV